MASRPPRGPIERFLQRINGLNWPARIASVSALTLAVSLSIIWAVLMNVQVAAAMHVLLPLLSMIPDPSRTLPGLAVCTVRWIIIQILQLWFAYPSLPRWALSLALSIAETVYFSYLESGMTIVAILTAWQVFASDIWLCTTERHLEHGEKRLLDLTSSVPTTSVTVAGISTLVVSRTSDNKPVLVCCHGYAAGKALFASSLAALAEHYQVYCIDWLGFGRSSRKQRFNARSVDDTERYFVDSLENWRIAMGFSSFHLLGHSMGGYLCSVYTIHYPDRVDHLFLVSPVGLPTRPEAERIRRSLFLRALHWLWDRGTTPADLLRLFGPFGPAAMRALCALRFGSFMTKEQTDALGDYVYHLNAAPLVGDRAIARLLHIGAWPRIALGPRLLALRETPITFLYGIDDWMDRTHAYDIAHDRAQLASPKTCRIYVIPEAGHQIFLMNPKAFTRTVLFEGLKIEGGKPFVVTVDENKVFFVQP
ncbi:unnamed protein product (mitochondrion) [Plasmodiophora brassicae]|uniref:AB hydrolase-1 domain-containing protein n=1 Tax=Plasmodiophora brassicae TaxID=37360 RepID=A0A0G4IUG8_PLABS|nr:hypothetical protein PBRA_007029 [Plasmodiophora brassicae]SPQ92988.1 unnamed protein product [Plasmodiophora brassicae]